MYSRVATKIFEGFGDALLKERFSKIFEDLRCKTNTYLVLSATALTLSPTQFPSVDMIVSKFQRQ